MHRCEVRDDRELGAFWEVAGLVRHLYHLVGCAPAQSLATAISERCSMAGGDGVEGVILIILEKEYRGSRLQIRAAAVSSGVLYSRIGLLQQRLE